MLALLTLGAVRVGTAAADPVLPLPAPVIADAAAYFPLVERALVYRVTVGAYIGQAQTHQVARGKRPGGSPAWRFQMSPTLSAFLDQTDDGDLLMPAISDFDEGVVMTTTPPNAFVLKGMQPGDSRPFTQTVSVNYLDQPDKQDWGGMLSGSFSYVGAYEVTVPAGTFETILLRTRCAGKIGPAHTEDTAYYFLARGVGVVAMVTQEDAEAFWVVNIDTTIGKTLVSK